MFFRYFAALISDKPTTVNTPRPGVPFPGVRFWVVTSPVALQRAGAVPNMDFLLFPRSFPLPEPAGDSVDRPVVPTQKKRAGRQTEGKSAGQ